MSASLATIWSAPRESLQDILTSKGIKSGDIRKDRINVSIVYHNANFLSEDEAKIVRNPNFNSVMLSVDTLQEGLNLLTLNNDGLKAHFERLVELLMKQKDTYRVKTFKLAAGVVSEFKEKITTPDQLKDIKGIGASTLQEVREYLATGTSKRRKELEASLPPTTLQDEIKRQNVLEQLRSVHGIGEKKAEELYAAGYQSLESLHTAPLTDAQRIGYKWYLHLQQRIPRSEIDEYALRLQHFLPLHNKWSIVGSYRRGEADSGDIDILLCNETGIDLKSVVDHLVASNIVVDVIALGPSKFMGISRLGEQYVARRIDIRLFDPQHWGAALLYNTGSQQFNILMRLRAQSLGYKLNEYGLFRSNSEEVLTRTEEDIFVILKVAYLAPFQRVKDIKLLTFI